MKTKINSYLQLLLGLLGLVILWLGYLLLKPQHKAKPAFELHKGQQTMLIDSLGNRSLVRYVPVEKIMLQNSSLKIGSHQLQFKKDTIGQTTYFVPSRPYVWKNYFSSFLGTGSHTTDTLLIWKETQQKWGLVLNNELNILSKNPDWKKLNAEQQLVHALVTKLSSSPQTTILIQDKSLSVYALLQEQSVKKMSALQIPAAFEADSPTERWLLYLLLGIGAVALLAAMVLTMQQPKSQPVAQAEVTSDDDVYTNMASNETLTNPKVEPVNLPIEQYLDNFYDRYGDFYKYLNEVGAELSITEKQKVMQDLVEMALHIHSLARNYHHTKNLKKLNSDLNNQLILENKNVKDLNDSSYQLFSDDPEKIKKAQRLLVRLLREMGLNQLEGVLLTDVYVSPENFKAKQ